MSLRARLWQRQFCTACNRTTEQIRKNLDAPWECTWCGAVLPHVSNPIVKDARNDGVRTATENVAE
jgi:ribosomal protein L37AE/L43A